MEVIVLNYDFIHKFKTETKDDELMISISFYDKKSNTKALELSYKNDIQSIKNKIFFHRLGNQIDWFHHTKYPFFTLHSLEHKCLQLLKDELPILSFSFNQKTAEN